jgi:hypothetical protein
VRITHPITHRDGHHRTAQPADDLGWVGTGGPASRSRVLTRKLSGVAVVPIALVALLAGCGSSSSSGATANKASFCADNAKLDKATASDNSLAELLKTLRANQSTVGDFGKTAPSAIRAQAQVLVTGADTAIKANNTASFGTQKFASAGKAVDAFCGQDAGGTSTS